MYDWLGLEHLYATGRPIIEDDIDRLFEMPACTRIQERQRKFFRIPPSWPVKSVTVPCASIDPDAGFEDHFCIKGEPDIVRHGPRDFTASDRRIANAPTSLLIDRQRFLCRTCGKVWSEAMPDIREDHEMTRRLHRDLAIASTEDPFEKVAARYGVHEKMVRTIFHEYSAAMLEGFQFDLPEVLGLDDTRLLGHPRLVCTDVREGKILDIFEGNSRESVRESLRKHAYHFNVRIVVMDMSTLYRSAVKDVFEWADIVVDKFHVIQLVTNAMDQARIAFTDDGLPQPLAAELRQQSRIFNKNRFKLTAKQQQLLKDIKKASPQLARAHRLKEKFERIYSYANRVEAEYAFDEWCNLLENTKYSKVNEHFLSVRNTVGKEWRTEIFNYWTHGRFTSAFTESMNANLKRINRYAKGLDFETLRAKAILRYGHYHTSSEIYEHRLPIGLTAQELDETLDARIWKGFSADTLARSLRAGMFEGEPPDLSVRPVVLPDGRNREALEEAEQDEIDAAWDACPGRPKPSPEMEQWYASPYRPNGIRDCTVSYPLPPLRNLSVHDERRRIDPAYAPATHFRGRGRGHGRGRGISLDNLPEHERWARKPNSALSRRERRMLRLEQEVMAGPWPEGEPSEESFDQPSRS